MYAWYSVIAFLVALTFYNVRYAFMKVIGQKLLDNAAVFSFFGVRFSQSRL